MKKKLFLLTALMTISFTLPAFSAVEDTGFDDVSADYEYAEGIEYCVDNGVIRRTGVTEFSPEENLNRELLACILFRMEESPATESDITFDDVETGRWFQTSVIWAAENSVLTGYGNGSFGVNDGVTEEQLYTALYRYAGSPAVTGGSSVNTDNVSDWAVQAVQWAAENNIMADENSFEPKAVVTRGKAAQVMMNYLNLYETPYIVNGGNNIVSETEEAEFIPKVRLTVEGKEGEAIVSLIDSKPTREFISQLPMTVDFSDFGDREVFGAMPIALSENEALLSGYEIGDFSYGTPYDSMIIFYAQDNEIIDGIIKLGTFESGLDLFTGKEPIKVTIEAVTE